MQIKNSFRLMEHELQVYKTQNIISNKNYSSSELFFVFALETPRLSSYPIVEA